MAKISADEYFLCVGYAIIFFVRTNYNKSSSMTKKVCLIVMVTTLKHKQWGFK